MAVDLVSEISKVRANSVQIESRPSSDYTVNNGIKEVGKESEKRLVSEEQYIKFIEEANKKLIGPDTRLEFSIHKGTHEVVVKIINEETNEIIKEIPPEKLLDLVAKIWEIVGLFVDKRI
ncbi:MAG: flagellar protein FlaG [Thermoanaerobacteraceae bacterium]|nr:flagellar protein FlaG [Thermoanaerobacteraceae bacterium]